MSILTTTLVILVNNDLCDLHWLFTCIIIAPVYVDSAALLIIISTHTQGLLQKKMICLELLRVATSVYLDWKCSNRIMFQNCNYSSCFHCGLLQSGFNNTAYVRTICYLSQYIQNIQQGANLTSLILCSLCTVSFKFRTYQWIGLFFTLYLTSTRWTWHDG